MKRRNRQSRFQSNIGFRTLIASLMLLCINLSGCNQPPQPGDPFFEDQVFEMTDYDAWDKDELQMISFHSRIHGYVDSDRNPESEFMFLVGRPGPILVTLVSKTPGQDLDMEIFSADRTINIGSFSELSREAFVTVLPRGAFYLTVNAFAGKSEYELTLSYPNRHTLNMHKDQFLYHFVTREDKTCVEGGTQDISPRTQGGYTMLFDLPEQNIYALADWYADGSATRRKLAITRMQMPYLYEGAWRFEDPDFDDYWETRVKGEIEIEYAFAGLMEINTDSFVDGDLEQCEEIIFLHSGQKLL